MKVLGIIPARGGSKGVPRKNMKVLGGKPLIAYTLEQAKQSELLTDVILSSEDSEIIEWALKNGLEVPFTRPLELSTDNASSIDVVLHAIRFLSQKGRNYDAVCLLQPSSPFRESGMIDRAIEKFINLEVDSLISVLPVPHEYNPHWVFEENSNGLLVISTGEKEIIKRRQELPVVYFRDGSIYLTKTEVLLNQHSFYGDKTGSIVSNPAYYCNIDTQEDWEKAVVQVNKISKSIF